MQGCCSFCNRQLVRLVTRLVTRSVHCVIPLLVLLHVVASMQVHAAAGGTHARAAVASMLADTGGVTSGGDAVSVLACWVARALMVHHGMRRVGAAHAGTTKGILLGVAAASRAACAVISLLQQQRLKAARSSAPTAACGGLRGLLRAIMPAASLRVRRGPQRISAISAMPAAELASCHVHTTLAGAGVRCLRWHLALPAHVRVVVLPTERTAGSSLLSIGLWPCHGAIGCPNKARWIDLLAVAGQRHSPQAPVLIVWV